MSATAADATAPEFERLLLRSLEARGEVQEAYLFGSQATGRAQSHSDIDIAVRVDDGSLIGKDYGYAAEFTAYLMSALSSNQVDVVILNRAPPVLYHRILRDGRRVFARDLRATAAREGYAFSRYCDYLPQLAKIEAARRAGAARRGR